MTTFSYKSVTLTLYERFTSFYANFQQSYNKYCLEWWQNTWLYNCKCSLIHPCILNNYVYKYFFHPPIQINLKG